MGENGVMDDEIAGEQIDWENMMFDENQEADMSLFDPSLLSDLSLPLPNDPSLSNPPPDSFPLSIAEIEQLLMFGDDDDDHNNAAFTNKVVADEQALQFSNDFLSDFLRDSPVESDRSVEVVDPLDGGKNSSSATCSEEEEQDKTDVLPQKENGNGNGGDAINKKKQRQLRNRDAAVRSRERKKMYVRDLEMKSRYLEGECKRLGILLQCCVAENQALRLSLQNAKGFDASTTKQESAVLLLESLLLGSLLWFLGIVCLLILPIPLQSTLEAVPPENADKKDQGSLVPRKAENKIFRLCLFRSSIVSKRCKASRSRMKPSSHNLEVLA